MLKQITTRYEAPCSKCQRNIQVGWKAYFQAEPKKLLFCKPCGEAINAGETDNPQTTPPAPEENKEIKEVLGILDFNTNTINSMDDRMRGIDLTLTTIQLTLSYINASILELQPKITKSSKKT